MNEYSPALLIALAMTFLVAGTVKGVTGMGLPTVAMGLLGMVMPPAAAAAILVVPSLVTNLWQLLAGPATLRLLRRLWTMISGIGIGTVAGSAMLASLDPQWSSPALGIALMLYAGFALFAPAFTVRPNVEPWLSPLIGLATGLVTGATGVFVFPAVPYLQALGMERDELVQSLGLSFTASTLALAAGLLLHGAFHVEQLGMSSLAIAPALAGMWLGQRIKARISPTAFRLCFLSFLLLLGLELATRPLR